MSIIQNENDEDQSKVPNTTEKTKTSSVLIGGKLDYPLFSNEEIVWSSKPSFLYTIIETVVNTIVVYLLILIVSFFAYDYVITNIIELGLFTYFTLITSLFVLFEVLFWPLYVLSLKNTHYFLTNKRILMTSGVFGLEVESIDHDKIFNHLVNINPVQNLFKIGTIKLGGIGMNMFNLPEPYEAYALIKRVIFDVKTDMYFPNAYRPDENPGYKTKYSRKFKN